jgi:exodeoxyribonuclease-3
MRQVMALHLQGLLFPSRQPNQSTRNDFDGPRSILTLNLQNPSPKRMQSIVGWVDQQTDDIFVFTELQWKDGTASFVAELQARGFFVIHDGHTDKGYITIAASRHPARQKAVETHNLRGRVVIFDTDLPLQHPVRIWIVGVYGPVCGVQPDPMRDTQRRAFQEAFETRILARLAQITDPVIIAGDLNVVEREFHRHVRRFSPHDYRHYERYGEFDFVDLVRHFNQNDPEYTWFSPIHGGERLDHAFINRSMIQMVGGCSVVHEVRHKKLSDHSAIRILFASKDE